MDFLRLLISFIKVWKQFLWKILLKMFISVSMIFNETLIVRFSSASSFRLLNRRNITKPILLKHAEQMIDDKENFWNKATDSRCL